MSAALAAADAALTAAAASLTAAAAALKEAAVAAAVAAAADAAALAADTAAAAAAAIAASMVAMVGPLTIPFALQARTESVTGSSARKLSPLRPDVFANLSEREADSAICWTIMQRRSRFNSCASCG